MENENADYIADNLYVVRFVEEICTNGKKFSHSNVSDWICQIINTYWRWFGDLCRNRRREFARRCDIDLWLWPVRRQWFLDWSGHDYSVVLLRQVSAWFFADAWSQCSTNESRLRTIRWSSPCRENVRLFVRALPRWLDDDFSDTVANRAKEVRAEVPGSDHHEDVELFQVDSLMTTNERDLYHQTSFSSEVITQKESSRRSSPSLLEKQRVRQVFSWPASFSILCCLLLFSYIDTHTQRTSSFVRIFFSEATWMFRRGVGHNM